MNYGTEPWYKLYIRESTEDKLLPVLNRGLRDFLLRLAKSRNDATILGRTENPGHDLARALGAHPEEFETVVGFVQSMLDDGYLSHKRGRLWITNFVKAQAARSPGAVRQERWRKGNADSGNSPGDETYSDVSRASPGDVTVASRETSHKRRGEERREEEKRTEENRDDARARDPSVVGSDSEPEPDPGRETMCPTDLAKKLEANGTIARLAEQLSEPIESVRHEAEQFVLTWTFGKLAGQRRSGWAGKCRQWIIDQKGKNRLKPAGAIEHRQAATDDDAALMQRARRGEYGKRIQDIAETSGNGTTAADIRELVRKRAQKLTAEPASAPRQSDSSPVPSGAVTSLVAGIGRAIP